jgi:hypothetical protein
LNPNWQERAESAERRLQEMAKALQRLVRMARGQLYDALLMQECDELLRGLDSEQAKV